MYPSDIYLFNFTVGAATNLHGLQCSDAVFGTEVADAVLNPKLRCVTRLQDLPPSDQDRKPKFIESAVSHASRVAAVKKELQEKQVSIHYAKAGLPLVQGMHQQLP